MSGSIKVVVCNVPAQISPLDIYDTCRKFGIIEQIYVGFDTPQRIEMIFRDLIHAEAASASIKKLNSEMFVHVVPNQIDSAILDRNRLDRVETGEFDNQKKNIIDEKMNILDALNNDLLWIIFEHLNTVDLSEVAATCKHLNSLASRIFKNTGFDYNHFENQPLQRIETFFRYFGQYLSSVDANKFRSQQVVLGMIGKYCTNIKELSCTVCCQKTLAELQPILCKLRKLDILCGSEVEFKCGKILNTEWPIEQLILDHSGRIDLPQIKLERLIDLKLCSAYFCDEERVKNFFKLNRQLKKLHLERVLTLSGCNYILEGLTNLEELVLFDYALNYFSPNLSCFAELTKLKKLRLWANIADFGDTFKALRFSEIQLNYKELERDHTGKPIIEHDQNRRITCLKLYKPFTSINLRRGKWLCDRMLHSAALIFPNLREIYVESWKISLSGIFTALNAATQLQTASFVIRNSNRIDRQSTPTELRNALHSIQKLVTFRQIRTSIEIIKCDEQENVVFSSHYCNTWLDITITPLKVHRKRFEKFPEASLSIRVFGLDII